MDEKKITTSESIRILREVKGSVSRRQQIQESYKEVKCIGELEFDEFSNSTGYCSSSYDDEVFIDTDDTRDITRIRVIPEPRKRRTSDVIDSMGDSPPRDKSYFPTDFLDPGSPPVTPGSDMGYYSNCGFSSPPSLLNYKPAWSRFSSLSIDGPSLEEKKPGHWDQTDADDESDAKPNRDPSYLTQNTSIGPMPVARDSEEYCMNHTFRGYAHIFNHDVFDKMPERKGSKLDVDQLEATYKLLGFDVIVHDNLDLTGITQVIRQIADEDHSDRDCLSISILTHGQEPNLLYSRDYIYSFDLLWQSFTPDKCVTLAGKPKVFFVQACRGQKLDSGIHLVRASTEIDSGCDSYKIPKMADFLIAYSTAEGYYSWRNPENGTWFVQSLCRVLREHHLTKDLLRMLTIVSRIVAVEHESYNDTRLDRHAQKQVPSISSTLIRDLYWKPKNS